MAFLYYVWARGAQEALSEALSATVADTAPNETWFILPWIKVFVA